MPLVMAAAIAAVVVVTAGVAIYWDRLAPLQTPVVVVDGTPVRMGYFLKRVSLSGSQPLSVLQVLASEQIIKSAAPRPPYNISVTETEVDQFLREIARGSSEKIGDGEYKEWYRQQLNESRLSPAEFRDLARTNVMSRKLHQYLADRVPTVGEQVHLYVIATGSYDEATRAAKRLASGGDFAAVARDASADEQLRASGGDAGWTPRGALNPAVADFAFEAGNVGRVSDPIGLDQQHFVIVKVAERVPAREIDKDSLDKLKAAALNAWLAQEYQRHKIEYRGFKGGYDSETDAWVNWRVARMKSGNK